MWQVKLCDPVLTHAIPEQFRDEQLIIKRCTNKAYFTFYFYNMMSVFQVCFNNVGLFVAFVVTC